MAEERGELNLPCGNSTLSILNYFVFEEVDQLPRLGKRELICLLLFTCNYVVSVWRGFLFLWVLGMGYIILLWHSLSLPLGQSFLIFRFTDPLDPIFWKLKKNKRDFFQFYFFISLRLMPVQYWSSVMFFRFVFSIAARLIKLPPGLIVYLSVTYQIQLNIQIYIKIKHI